MRTFLDGSFVPGATKVQRSNFFHQPDKLVRWVQSLLLRPAGDAGADQRLVADEPEGEADQDRCEGREPRPLRCLPDGRGRHPTESVRRHSAAHRGTAAAASHIYRVKRSFATRPSQTHGSGAPR
jgi:hypothetical protein